MMYHKLSKARPFRIWIGLKGKEKLSPRFIHVHHIDYPMEELLMYSNNLERKLIVLNEGNTCNHSFLLYKVTCFVFVPDFYQSGKLKGEWKCVIIILPLVSLIGK